MTVIAYRDGKPVSSERFAADVAGLMARLEGCARGGLAARDAYGFAVGLFALAGLGATAVVPPNLQPGTLAALSDSWDVLVDGEAEPAEPRPLADDCALEFFTSGSTGAPKRVDRRLSQFRREAEALEAMFPGGGPVMGTVPHQHVYGLTFRVLWPIFAGRPFVAEADAVWEGLLARLEPGCTIITGPAHLTRLAGLAPPAGRPHRIFSAGAPLPAAAARAAEALFGVAPTEIFGSTETGAVATRTGDEAWRPLPGVTVSAHADHRMAVCGPWLAGDAMVTADRIEMAEGGRFRFLGRADRVVKVEGKRVSLPEVEAALAGLPWVAEAAVVALDDETPRLAAAVVLAPTGRLMLDELGAFRLGRELRRALSATLEPAGLPRSFRFIDSLPANAMGKTIPSELRPLFKAGA